ncbi:MAG: hypothetical protein GWM89_06230 [Candidatus Dadabacteria bacterium]|nr:hypothetical protein [Candidatus Dadabacteria bacterium]NIY22008.1 hypothetical protein [Candidatus Dadabacteria bacterium]
MNSQEINIDCLYLPRCDFFDNINRQIAIETDFYKAHGNGSAKNLTGNLKVDAGKITLFQRTRYKMSLNLRGSNINKTLLLIVPSWGRWTKKRIWLIVSSHDETD